MRPVLWLMFFKSPAITSFDNISYMRHCSCKECKKGMASVVFL